LQSFHVVIAADESFVLRGKSIPRVLARFESEQPGETVVAIINAAWLARRPLRALVFQNAEITAKPANAANGAREGIWRSTEAVSIGDSFPSRFIASCRLPSALGMIKK
jgi:hypothetical protein